MLPTPDTSHVCFDRVYEPAEDSYLLLDTLSSTSEAAFLREKFEGSQENSVSQHTSCSPLVLEVGTGSGVVLAFIAANADHLFGRDDLLVLGTDINRFACQAASKTVQIAIDSRSATSPPPYFLDIVNTDLLSSIRPHSIDVLVFNPPYVPSEMPDLSLHDSYNVLPPGKSSTSFDQESHLLALSYAGGVEGMETTNRLLEQLPDVLHPSRGVAYLLLCAQNKPEDVKGRIREWSPCWNAETVGTSGKQAGWEKLQIVRIWKDKSL